MPTKDPIPAVGLPTGRLRMPDKMSCQLGRDRRGASPEEHANPATTKGHGVVTAVATAVHHGASDQRDGQAQRRTIGTKRGAAVKGVVPGLKGMIRHTQQPVAVASQRRNSDALG